MCDTLCVVDGERLLFAKNSDRPIGEVQLVERWPRRPPSTATLHTQYLDLGPDPGAQPCVASRPAWLWGFEHGLNEHGVAIGNEKIWTTDDPRARANGLLGMDLVRLALERSTTADEALTTITALLEEHGQGGTGEQHAHEPYDNAFLVADPARAWIVETRDRQWAARRVQHGGAAISNRVSLGTNWLRAVERRRAGHRHPALAGRRCPHRAGRRPAGGHRGLRERGRAVGPAGRGRGGNVAGSRHRPVG